MKQIKTAVIAFLAVMALSGCNGPKNDAERVIKDFLKENLDCY